MPGQAPSSPFDPNWVYLINDKKVQDIFKSSIEDMTTLQPTQAITIQDQEELKANDIQQMQQQPPDNNNIEEPIDQEVIEPLEEPEQEGDFDYNSIPTQDLYLMAERTLQAIEQRLVAKQSALGYRLTAVLKHSETKEIQYLRSVYTTRNGCHLAMTRVPTINQVNNSKIKILIPSIQWSTTTIITPISRERMDRIIQEQDIVRGQTKELQNAIKCVRQISLPSDLTLNEGQAEVHLAENNLSIRQKMLLKQPINQAPKFNHQDPQPPQGILLTDQEVAQITFTHLHGDALDRIQDEPEGPLRLVVEELVDIGVDMKNGVAAVDQIRRHLTHSRNIVKKLKYSIKLRDLFIHLIENKRDKISSSLQYFLKMLLIPHEMIGLGKTKILLVFNDLLIRDRQFTVECYPKDRRNFNQLSSAYLKTLISLVESIENTCNAIKEFCEALNQVKFELEETVFLYPLLKQVIDQLKAATRDTIMETKHHQMKSLESVLRRITTRLIEPNLLLNLMNDYSKSRYYSIVSLQDIVRAQMGRLK